MLRMEFRSFVTPSQTAPPHLKCAGERKDERQRPDGKREERHRPSSNSWVLPALDLVAAKEVASSRMERSPENERCYETCSEDVGTRKGNAPHRGYVSAAGNYRRKEAHDRSNCQIEAGCHEASCQRSKVFLRTTTQDPWQAEESKRNAIDDGGDKNGDYAHPFHRMRQ